MFTVYIGSVPAAQVLHAERFFLIYDLHVTAGGLIVFQDNVIGGISPHVAFRFGDHVFLLSRFPQQNKAGNRAVFFRKSGAAKGTEPAAVVIVMTAL